MSPQLSCGDICQIWTRFKDSNICFYKIENFSNGEINELGFSKPNPRSLEQILQCSCPISNVAPFKTKICTILFWMVHRGICDRCIVGFVRLVYLLTPMQCLRYVTIQSKLISKGHGSHYCSEETWASWRLKSPAIVCSTVWLTSKKTSKLCISDLSV